MVQVPVLVGFGADTSWWHRRAAQELAAELPTGQVVTVAGAGHGVHLTHPTATADLVRRAVAAGTAPQGR
jgi:pimeloyl-ACP methyl ester carboxylesterase